MPRTVKRGRPTEPHTKLAQLLCGLRLTYEEAALEIVASEKRVAKKERRQARGLNSGTLASIARRQHETSPATARMIVRWSRERCPSDALEITDLIPDA